MRRSYASSSEPIQRPSDEIAASVDLCNVPPGHRPTRTRDRDAAEKDQSRHVAATLVGHMGGEVYP
jgi:hypothetical protein